MKSPVTTPAPAPAAHPNMRGTEPRTRLAGGPFVDTTTTLAQFDMWMQAARAAGLPCSQGIIIDRLAAFAKRAGYDPVTDVLAMPAAAVPTPAKVNPGTPKSRRG
jgi:hypothetical protein